MKRLLREMLARYAAVVAAAFLFSYSYAILMPLTVYSVYAITKIFFDAWIAEISFQGQIAKTIVFDGKGIVFISSCIAASAYYLLFILNMTTARIKIKKRIAILFFDFFIFLFLNISRILLLAMLIGTEIFASAHWLFWHALSTIFVVLIWLFTIKAFKIKEVPVYSDALFLMKAIKKKSKVDKGNERKFL